MAKSNKKAQPTSLREMLIIKLQALYDIETELVKTLPKLSKLVTNEDLKNILDEHASETKQQAVRLERALNMLDDKPTKMKIAGIRGILDDGQWLAKNTIGEAGIDAGIAASNQYIEHYEMAGYGTAIAWAQELGEEDVAALLEETLEEEKLADQKINELALSTLNEGASTVGAEIEEEEE